MAEDETPKGGGGSVELPAVGKVPKTWLYVGGATVAAVVAYAYWKRRQVAAAPELVVDPATGATGETGYRNPAPQSGTTVPPPGTADPNAITTNAQWTTAVVSSMANLGVDSQFVLLVLSKYLASVPLTPDEASVVRQAWALHAKPPQGPSNFTLVVPGSPPTPAPTPPPTPTPTPSPTPPPRTPAPAPAPARTHRVVSGDTLWDLAIRYYGSGGRKGEIYSRNSGAIEAAARAHGRANSDNGHWIYPGTILTIP